MDVWSFNIVLQVFVLLKSIIFFSLFYLYSSYLVNSVDLPSSLPNLSSVITILLFCCSSELFISVILFSVLKFIYGSILWLLFLCCDFLICSKRISNWPWSTLWWLLWIPSQFKHLIHLSWLSHSSCNIPVFWYNIEFFLLNLEYLAIMLGNSGSY